MPAGTRVHRCVHKHGGKMRARGVNPYAACQASTRQSYRTGKRINGKRKGRRGRRR